MDPGVGHDEVGMRQPDPTLHLVVSHTASLLARFGVGQPVDAQDGRIEPGPARSSDRICCRRGLALNAEMWSPWGSTRRTAPGSRAATAWDPSGWAVVSSSLVTTRAGWRTAPSSPATSASMVFQVRV